MNGELERQRKPRGSLGRLVPFMTSVFSHGSPVPSNARFCAHTCNMNRGRHAVDRRTIPGHAARWKLFHEVREAKVTTNCYHWPFLREVRRGKCLINKLAAPQGFEPRYADPESH